MTLESIEKSLREGLLSITNPHECAEARGILAGEYSFWSGQLEEIEVRKPEAWLAIRNREDVTSDKQADREWDLTEDGKNEIGISRKLKRIDKLMSALSTLLRVAENEAKNLH